MLPVIQIVIFFGFPLLLNYLEKRVKVIKTIGPILLCYAFGIIWANSGQPLDAGLSDTVSSVLIPIAIALILFNSDFTTLKKHLSKTGLSFFLLIVSVLSVSVAAAYIFSYVQEHTKIASMLVGCYTGGTPNLFAIGYGLNTDKNTIIVANLADQVIGGLYFLFIVTLAKPLLNKFTKQRYQKSQGQSEVKQSIVGKADLSMKQKTVQSIYALLMAIGALALSIGFSFLLTKEATNVAVIMLVVSAVGVALSFVKPVRANQMSYPLGQYLIYVFSLAVGTMADISLILGQSLDVLFMVAFILFVTMIVHFTLALIFKIDVDTIIIASIAGIFGPAFIIPTARAIKNESVVLIGIATGLLGYAVGNFLGFGLYELLKILF